MDSLFGDHDIYGPDSIRFYTQPSFGERHPEDTAGQLGPGDVASQQ